ncbi:MAG: hypothetical protein DRP82_02380 [Planctomycetota bacterium]|nr:MAG: hypothetical protein DRP82_02380 [Planctomycetota bacterium]
MAIRKGSFELEGLICWRWWRRLYCDFTNWVTESGTPIKDAYRLQCDSGESAYVNYPYARNLQDDYSNTMFSKRHKAVINFTFWASCADDVSANYHLVFYRSYYDDYRIGLGVRVVYGGTDLNMRLLLFICDNGSYHYNYLSPVTYSGTSAGYFSDRVKLEWDGNGTLKITSLTTGESATQTQSLSDITNRVARLYGNCDSHTNINATLYLFYIDWAIEA